jgi:hypothetical protein
MKFKKSTRRGREVTSVNFPQLTIVRFDWDQTNRDINATQKEIGKVRKVPNFETCLLMEGERRCE